MQIFLILIILAIIVLVTLAGIVVGSLLLGGMLATTRARVVAPVFLVVIPGTAVGALAGGTLVGYFAVRSNENLILLGPLGGLLAGAGCGLSVGVAGALFWWWRIMRSKRGEGRSQFGQAS